MALGCAGPLTTYSTFGYETLRPIGQRAGLLASLNAVASITAGFGAAYLGVAIAYAAAGV